MPIIKSAKKALRVGIRRKKENDMVRAKIKNAVKGTKLSIASKEKDLKTKITQLYKELDIAAKKHVLHKNKAARLKSRITKAANKIDPGEKETVKKASTKRKK